MSLVHLLKDVEIRRIVDPSLSRIPLPPKAEVRLKAPAKRPRARLVGTAFDYAVRFELQRLCPHAQTWPWIAEMAAAMVDPIAGSTAFCSQLDENEAPAWTVSGELANRYQRLVREARAAVDSYLVDSQPTAATRHVVAEHALRLARLDAFYRNGYPDPEPERIEEGDLPDLLALLEMVPWRDLVSPTTLWLNPNFGKQSRRVGGADADLISGDRLIDLKTTTKPTHLDDLRQILGYLILARAARSDDRAFPHVATVGIYYARHAFLWLLPTSTFTEHTDFPDLERQFLQRADEIRHPSPKRDLSKPAGPTQVPEDGFRLTTIIVQRRKAFTLGLPNDKRLASHYVRLRLRIHEAEDTKLTPAEWAMLNAIFQKAGHTFTRGEIAHRVGIGGYSITEAMVDACAQKIRAVFQLRGFEVVEAVRGKGYRVPGPGDARDPAGFG